MVQDRSQNSKILEKYLTDNYPEKLKITHNDIMKSLVISSNYEQILELITFLRDDQNLLFKELIDIFAVDYPEDEKRFELTYSLLSLKYNRRIFIKIRSGEEDLVPSVTSIYEAANWLEREVYDMYGVTFSTHPDLRRILTDYGFLGYPLRKDFPLTGYVEVRYDLEKKKVIYEPVNLAQDFRYFDFESPWEGTKYVLPGDEKATKD